MTEAFSVSDLRSELIALSGQSPEDLEMSDPRIVEDLDLDSLAMLEAMVMLEERFGTRIGGGGLVVRDWREVTVSQLYEELSRIADAA